MSKNYAGPYCITLFDCIESNCSVEFVNILRQLSDTNVTLAADFLSLLKHSIKGPQIDIFKDAIEEFEERQRNARTKQAKRVAGDHPARAAAKQGAPEESSGSGSQNFTDSSTPISPGADVSEHLGAVGNGRPPAKRLQRGDAVDVPAQSMVLTTSVLDHGATVVCRYITILHNYVERGGLDKLDDDIINEMKSHLDKVVLLLSSEEKQKDTDVKAIAARIRNNFTTITSTVNTIDLLDYLFQELVLEHHEVQEIEAKCSDKDKCREMLFKLLKKPEGCWVETFIEALRAIPMYHDLVHLLRNDNIKDPTQSLLKHL